jgi:hypothetical protein
MPHFGATATHIPCGLTLSELAQEILNQMPGSKIVADDWFAKRRASELRVVETLRRTGQLTDDRFVLHLIRSIERAEAENGAAKELKIPMLEKGTLQGRVSLRYTLLHSLDPIDTGTSERLTGILHSLGIVADVHVSSLVGEWRFPDEL